LLILPWNPGRILNLEEERRPMMDREALRQALREKLESDTGETMERLNDDMDLRAELGIDSIDMVNLVIHMQTEYGVQLESEELEPIVKLGQFLDLLQTKLVGVKREAA
jgi:acyl carrier protein